MLKNRIYPPTDYPWIHTLGIYSGAILVVTLPWLWIRRRALAQNRGVISFLAAFAAVMFGLALGRYGGLDLILTYAPGLGSLRAPVRYIVLAQFALATLAAIAFDDLATNVAHDGPLPWRDLRLLCVPAALSVLTIALATTGVPALATTGVPALATLPLATAAEAPLGAPLAVPPTCLLLLPAPPPSAPLAPPLAPPPHPPCR